MLKLSLILLTVAIQAHGTLKQGRYDHYLEEGEAFFEVHVKDLREQLRLSLRDNLCQEGGFVSACYELESSACRSKVQIHIEKCLILNPLSGKSVNVYGEGVIWAHRIGECVAQQLEQGQVGKFPKTPSCNKWTAMSGPSK